MTSITVEPYVFSGLQEIVVYELNAYGRPAGTGLDAYTGIEVYGAKIYALTLPAPRKVPHVGNDRLLKVQQFPSQEVASGEINVGAADLDLIAAVGGCSIVELAGARMIPLLSDLAGHEPNVGMILQQAALAKSGPQRYRFHIITSTKAILRDAGAGAEPIDLIYDIAPDPVDRYLWGADLAPLSDPSDPFSGVSESGALEAGVWSGFSAYRMRIASFIADGAEDSFLFPTDKQAADATNVAVYTATGETVTEEDPADYTVALTGVTFDTPPTLNHEVHIVYQRAES
jgi:hypothetical protein